MGRARAEVDEVPPGFTDEVERTVRESGALSLRRVKPAGVKLSRRAEHALFEKLARRGLERTATQLRVPLREQLAALLGRGEPIASAALRKELRGVSNAAELKLVTGELVRAGRAALVVRSGKEHIAPRSPALLSPGELRRLQELAQALARAATSARPRSGQPPRTLLRADVAALLDAARRALGEEGPVEPDRPVLPDGHDGRPERQPHGHVERDRPVLPDGHDGRAERDRTVQTDGHGGRAERQPHGHVEPDRTVQTDGRLERESDGRDDPVALVVAEARGQASATTGLAYVPQVVRALGDRLDVDALRTALVRAATSGLIELRPESGIELLSAADAAACPRGPDGSPLSWVRVVG